MVISLYIHLMYIVHVQCACNYDNFCYAYEELCSNEGHYSYMYIPYIGYISTHESLRVLNIRRLKISDTWPRVILSCIV